MGKHKDVFDRAVQEVASKKNRSTYGATNKDVTQHLSLDVGNTFAYPLSDLEDEMKDSLKDLNSSLKGSLAEENAKITERTEQLERERDAEVAAIGDDKKAAATELAGWETLLEKIHGEVTNRGKDGGETSYKEKK